MRKLFSLIAAVLFAGSMMADSYTITFKESGTDSDSGTGLTSTTVADYVATGAEYVSAVAPSGKVYNARTGRGLKFGNSSNPGAVTLTLATPVNVTSIVVTAMQYKDGEASLKVQDKEDYTTTSEMADYTYTYASATEVSTITVGTATKRGYVKQIVVNYDGGGVTPPSVATPVIAGEEEFTDSVIVTITCSTPETDIYYTTDGTTDPKCDCAAAPEYTQQIVLKATTTIMAAAYTGNDWSAVATKTFTKVEPAPKYYVVGTMTEWNVNEAYELTPDNAGLYKGEFTFAANDAFKIVKNDKAVWYPDGMGNDYVINEDGDYAITFNPEGGVQDWYYGYFNVMMKEPALTVSCADVYNMAKDDAVALNDVVVTFANGKNVWVKDMTGSMLIYLPANGSWNAGDVLSGVEGVLDIYNGVYEVKPNADQVAAVTATPAEAPAPEEMTAITTADMNKYIILKNMAVEGTFVEGTASNINLTLGESTIVLRNNFKNAYVFEAGKTYDITGVVTIYQNNPQIYFIDAEESGSEGEYTYDWEPTEAYQFDVEIGEVETIESEGVVLFGLTSADKQYFAYLMFFTPAAGIVAGTYPINTTMEPGTFSASPGGNDEMDFPCYFGVMDGDEYYYPFYMVSGSVTMNEDGMVVNATSYNGSTIKLTYVAPEEAIENTKVENAAVKFFENGQLIIEKNGVRFNAIGTRL